MSFRYKLYREDRDRSIRRYTLEELESMGTFMLRDICVREKIMTHSAGIDAKRLDRKALIELLYRYRGRNEEALADDFQEESVQIIMKLIEKAAIAAEKIEIPYKIELKKDIPLLAGHEVSIQHGFLGETFLGVLADSKGEIKAVFEVQKSLLTLSPRRLSKEITVGVYHDLSFILFDASSSLKALQAYNGQKCNMTSERGIITARAVLPVLSVTEAVSYEEPLIIDFGAANTSAAVADEADGMLNVRFQKDSCLCPSMAAVESCKDSLVSFKFGHEALQLIRRDAYASSITYLHNLKLYLYEEKILDVCDCEGNGASISSDLVLQQFFLYLICMAKAGHGRNYRKIRFLMPEKRRQLALDRIRKLLPDYQIEAAESESVNSIYQEIIEHISDKDRAGPVRELAFHCGGGSTSLVDCRYTVENTNVAYKVILKERYINGDSGFGGNNLTYLILMYLKIKILCEIKGDTREILDEHFNNAYSYVDQYGGTKEVYQQFQRFYAEAEQVIPTRFQAFEADRQLKKQNFYRLWFLAEKLKLTFFTGSTLSMITLPDRFEEYCAVSVRLPEGISEYRLTFQVHREELITVMAPEIYRIVKSLIEPQCNEDGILMGYKIKFSGLSCGIPAFRDALREFTVGRRARTGNGSPYGLKLRALEGAVRRGQMLKSGKVIPEITREEAAASYIVAAKSHNGASVRILSGEHVGNEVFGHVTRHLATREVEFEVCDLFENVVRKRIVALDYFNFEETGYDELFDMYPAFREIQGDIDSIGSEDIRLFVFKQENWDFCVIPIARKSGILKVDKVSRFLFDDDSVDYFCGLY